MIASASAKTVSRRGRPTKEDASRLDRAIRNAALESFLERGYDATTMDEIAVAASTTKSTVYARYAGKEQLFREVLGWAIARHDWPFREPEAPDPADLEAALRAVAHTSVRRTLHPATVRLSRIAIAQAERFPDLFRLRYAVRTWPGIEYIVELLEMHARTGDIELTAEPILLAEIFQGMVSTAVAHHATLGAVRSRKAMTERTDVAVDTFLRSLRPDRQPAR